MKKSAILRSVLLLLAAGALVLQFTACGGGSADKEAAYDPTAKIVDLPPGADPSVPAEQGGAGFEEIAEDLGFVTYHFTDEDYKYYGDPRAKKGGMITTYTSRFPATMRTVGQHSNYVENNMIGSMIYESLLSTHPVNLEPTPSLASHWKISDDKLTYWYRINPNARFSDGMPVTAEDVILTWKLHMDKGILAPSDQMTYGKFEEPVAESKYIVRVVSKQLNWRNFLYFSGLNILPAHKMKEIAAKHDVSVDSIGKFYLKEYQYKMMPGSGSYYIKSKDIHRQQSYTLTRRTDYWDSDDPRNRYSSNFDQVMFIVIKDNDRLPFEKFKKGELDLYQVGRAQWWVEETNFENVRKGYVQKRRIYTDYPSGTGGFAFNMREWPFDDQRVRKAFRYLFNREGMIKNLFFDQYYPLDSHYAASMYENPDNPKFRYNPQKAIDLLKQAGYNKKNDNGILVRDDGTVFSFEMGITKTMERIITPFQQELREVGVDLQLKFQDGNALWKRLMERQFKMHWVNWGGLIFPNPETSLKSDLAMLDNTNNISGVQNPVLDSLFAVYDTLFSQQRRVEVVRTIDKLAMEEDHMAMSWYAPYQRVLYWNKFGHPDYYLGRYGDSRGVYTLWWYDEAKDKALKAAMESGEPLEVGETEVTYWPEYRKTHP